MVIWFKAGKPDVWDLMPDNLKWNWYNNNKVYNIWICSNPLETIPSSISRKKCLPWTQSLVPERLQITGLKSSWLGEISSPKRRDSHLPYHPWATASSGFLDNAPKGMTNIYIIHAPFFFCFHSWQKIFLTGRGFFPSAREHGLCPVRLGSVGLYKVTSSYSCTLPLCTDHLTATSQWPGLFHVCRSGGFGGAECWLHLWPTC